MVNGVRLLSELVIKYRMLGWRASQPASRRHTPRHARGQTNDWAMAVAQQLTLTYDDSPAS